MTIPNATLNPSQVQGPYERPIIRSETLILKVTAVAFGILISLSSFVLGGPIEGVIITTLVCSVLITLFEKNIHSGNSPTHVFVEREIPRGPAPYVVLREPETHSCHFFSTAPRRSSPSFRPTHSPQRVPVGTGAQSPILHQTRQPPTGYVPAAASPPTAHRHVPASARPPATVQPIHVGVGSGNVIRETPVPGNRVGVGSGRRG